MYYCPFCQHGYPTSNHLMAHMKLKHSVKWCKKFQCQQPNCWRTFSNSSSYMKHLALKHPLPMQSLTIPKHRAPENVTDFFFRDVDSCDSSGTSPVKVDVCNSDNLECNITVEEFRQLVSDGCASSTAKLYANNTINRSVVQDIIASVDELFSSSCIELIRRKYNSIHSSTKNNDVNDMLDILSNAFNNLKTEYQRMKFFDSCSTLIKPIPFVVGTSMELKTINRSKDLGIVDLTGQLIPMGEILTKFLELPNVFNYIVSHINELKEDELNNPLGSHKCINKLGAVYFTLGCIPPQYSSLLENIFLAQLHNSQDHNTFGNKDVFRKLILEIINLEKNGIIINTGTVKKKVYFVLTKILDENLGLHSILSFTESFNANYVCRFCRVDKLTLQSQTSEDISMLRTKVNYADDLLRCKYGIKGRCIFNDIPSYDLIDNPTCDSAYDILEGGFWYTMGKICQVLINVDKLFSLDQLNERVRFFKYGSTMVGNSPPTITHDFLRKQVIVFSASEMLCFVYYFGLIIGDLVPNDNEVWQLYIVVRKILSVVMAISFRKKTTDLLRTLVKQHHSLYLQLFREPLKPKHHFMLHHSTCIEKCGPLCDMSTIRFEGNHRDFKQNAKVVTSRINIAYTLA
ncbi:uncharacterized protein LOC124407968 [Diprion similis]|uniref:uncharacterized protein LOC124407968 n=1 Tax=Diprion similis TaxID=362088 RepID=UPI001EF8886A|nr:uncharacterized protein LOC124407968 [Diprion similis]